MKAKVILLIRSEGDSEHLLARGVLHHVGVIYLMTVPYLHVRSIIPIEHVSHSDKHPQSHRRSYRRLRPLRLRRCACSSIASTVDERGAD